MPAFSFVVTALTAYQTVAGLRYRWLSYRGAVQGLWKACMLYRGRVGPFERPDDAEATAALAEKVAEICSTPEGLGGQKARDALRQALDLLRLPPPVPGRFAHTPDGGLTPPLDGNVGAVLDGRLRSQRQWYLRKARRYRAWYLFYQGAIGATSFISGLFATLHGMEFWAVAVTTTLTLSLVACRDFLDHGPQWLQYRQAAVELEGIEQAF